MWPGAGAHLPEPPNCAGAARLVPKSRRVSRQQRLSSLLLREWGRLPPLGLLGNSYKDSFQRSVVYEFNFFSVFLFGDEWSQYFHFKCISFIILFIFSSPLIPPHTLPHLHPTVHPPQSPHSGPRTFVLSRSFPFFLNPSNPQPAQSWGPAFSRSTSLCVFLVTALDSAYEGNYMVFVFL